MRDKGPIPCVLFRGKGTETDKYRCLRMGCRVHTTAWHIPERRAGVAAKTQEPDLRENVKMMDMASQGYIHNPTETREKRHIKP